MFVSPPDALETGGLNFQSHRSNGRTECVLRPFNHSPFRHPLRVTASVFLSCPPLGRSANSHPEATCVKGVTCRNQPGWSVNSRNVSSSHQTRACPVELQNKVGNVLQRVRQKDGQQLTGERMLWPQQGPYRQTFQVADFQRCKPASPSASGVSEIAAFLPLSPASDAPSAQPSRPSLGTLAAHSAPGPVSRLLYRTMFQDLVL